MARAFGFGSIGAAITGLAGRKVAGKVLSEAAKRVLPILIRKLEGKVGGLEIAKEVAETMVESVAGRTQSQWGDDLEATPDVQIEATVDEYVESGEWFETFRSYHDILKMDAASEDPFQRRWKPMLGYSLSLCGTMTFLTICALAGLGRVESLSAMSSTLAVVGIPFLTILAGLMGYQETVSRSGRT